MLESLMNVLQWCLNGVAWFVIWCFLGWIAIAIFGEENELFSSVTSVFILVVLIDYFGFILI